MISSTEGGGKHKGLSERVSFFDSVRNVTPIDYFSLSEIFEKIVAGEWKAEVEEARRLLAAGDASAFKAIKAKLPAFTMSGSVFSREVKKMRWEDHSGYLQADLDRDENDRLANLDAVRNDLRADPHVAGFFVSPSGVGLKVMMRVNATLETHNACYQACSDYLREKYDLHIDKNVKDPARLCFVSFDPEAFVNPDAVPIQPAANADIPIAKKTRDVATFPPPSTDLTGDDVSEMLSYIPRRPDYDTWLKISSAVWSLLPMEEGTQRLMAWSPEEKTGEYAIKWAHRLKEVNIGSLVWFAQQHGFDASAAAAKKRWCGFIKFAGNEAPAKIAERRLQQIEIEEPCSISELFVKECFNHDQRGDADLFVKLVKDFMLFDNVAKKWKIFDNNFWQITHRPSVICQDLLCPYYEHLLEKIKTDLGKEKDEKRKRPFLKEMDEMRGRLKKINSDNYIRGVLNIAKEFLPTTPNEFDKDVFLFGVLNGTIDLRNNEFRESWASDKISSQMPVEFEYEAKCPKWEAAIKLWFGGDDEVIAFIRRAVGYSLSGSVDANTIFVVHGSGANGKTTFQNALRRLFGAYYGQIKIEAMLKGASLQDRDRATAKMPGKRLILSSEIPQRCSLNESLFKDLSGSDDITTRALYQEEYTFKPTHKTWIFGNHQPKISDDSHGLWRRVCLIPFDKPIPDHLKKHESEINKDIGNELAGILNWALDGWCDYVQRGGGLRGLAIPKVISDATKEYQINEDHFGAFLKECTCDKEGERIKMTTVLSVYKKWCEETGERPLFESSRALIKKFRERKLIVKPGHCALLYLYGIEVKFGESSGEPKLAF